MTLTNTDNGLVLQTNTSSSAANILLAGQNRKLRHFCNCPRFRTTDQKDLKVSVQQRLSVNFS